MSYLRGVRGLYAHIILIYLFMFIMLRIRHPFRLLRPAALPFLCTVRISHLPPNLNTRNMSNTTPKVQKSEDEWRAVLNKEQFRILREKGTEAAGTGEYENTKADGMCSPPESAL